MMEENSENVNYQLFKERKSKITNNNNEHCASMIT